MKRLLPIFMLILVFTLTACGGPTVAKGLKYIDKEKYDKAIEVFNQVLEKDSENYDAWFGIVEAQIQDESYRDAGDTLEDIYKTINKAYKAELKSSSSSKTTTESSTTKDDSKSDSKTTSSSDLTDVVETFLDYCKEVDDEKTLGSWYEKMVPTAPDLSEFDYGTFNVGDTIEIPLTDKNVEVYYNLDNKEVSKKQEKYDGKALVLDKEGEFTYSVAAFNLFGKSNDAYMTVTVAVPPELPVLVNPSGTYASPFEIKFNDPGEGFSIYYTTDGSDPTSGYWYDPEYLETLAPGTYKLRAVTYSDASYIYSEETTADYVIEPAGAPAPDKESGSFTGPLRITFPAFDPETQAIAFTFDGSDPKDYSYNDYAYVQGFDFKAREIYNYNPELGIVLPDGTYKIKAAVYDYNTYEMSKISELNYTVTGTPTTLTPSVAPGSYDKAFSIVFLGLNTGTSQLYYTTDGSDPTTSSNYQYYYEYSGIPLVSGKNTIKVTTYDYNTGDYSPAVTYEYTIK